MSEIKKKQKKEGKIKADRAKKIYGGGYLVEGLG